MRHNAFVALLLFLLLGGAQCGDPDLTHVSLTEVLTDQGSYDDGDPDLTHVSLTEVLADLGSYDGRRVEMNVRNRSPLPLPVWLKT